MESAAHVLAAAFYTLGSVYYAVSLIRLAQDARKSKLNRTTASQARHDPADGCAAPPTRGGLCGPRISVSPTMTPWLAILRATTLASNRPGFLASAGGRLLIGVGGAFVALAVLLVLAVRARRRSERRRAAAKRAEIDAALRHLREP